MANFELLGEEPAFRERDRRNLLYTTQCSFSFEKSLGRHPPSGKMDTPTLLDVPLESEGSGLVWKADSDSMMDGQMVTLSFSFPYTCLSLKLCEENISHGRDERLPDQFGFLHQTLWQKNWLFSQACAK